MTRSSSGSAARSRPVDAPVAPVPALVAADLLALVLFVVVGIRSHHEGSAVSLFLRNTIPLVGSWVLVAALLGTYRRPGLGTLARTWIVAVAIALVVRSAWVGSPSEIAPFLTFLGVGLAFTLLFLLAGRGLVAVGARRAARRRRT